MWTLLAGEWLFMQTLLAGERLFMRTLLMGEWLFVWTLLLTGEWLVPSLTAGASTGAPASGVPSRPTQMSLKPATMGAAGGGGGMFKDMGMLQGVPSSVSRFAVRAVLHWWLTSLPVHPPPTPPHTCAMCVVGALVCVCVCVCSVFIHWCVVTDSHSLCVYDCTFTDVLCWIHSCISVSVHL